MAIISNNFCKIIVLILSVSACGSGEGKNSSNATQHKIDNGYNLSIKCDIDGDGNQDIFVISSVNGFKLLTVELSNFPGSLHRIASFKKEEFKVISITSVNKSIFLDESADQLSSDDIIAIKSSPSADVLDIYAEEASASIIFMKNPNEFTEIFYAD